MTLSRREQLQEAVNRLEDTTTREFLQILVVEALEEYGEDSYARGYEAGKQSLGTLDTQSMPTVKEEGARSVLRVDGTSYWVETRVFRKD